MGPRPQGQRPPGPRHGGGHGPQQQPNKGANWVQVRDAVRRDLEVALQSLSFLERFGEGLDSQRRLFIDFPRVTEEMRSGAMERLAGAMEHLYEGGQGALDLARFLRDLPLALGHLAAAEFAAARQKQQQAAAAAKRAAEPPGAATGAADSSASAEGATSDAADPTGDATRPEPHGDASGAAAESSAAAPSAVEHDSGAATAAPEAEASPDQPPAQTEAPKTDISPRVELRTRLLAAAPNLAKAAQAFRRNCATVRRAAAPRRAVGPWRSDKEVLEQARRAIEFANKVYDAYAEAWNDAPLAKNAGPEAAAEMDRFLAWTQLSRYAEVARTQPPGSGPKTHDAAPGVKTEKPGHSQPPPAKTDAAESADAAPADAAPADAAITEPAATTTAASP